jgi:hypothetical protein
MRESQMKKIIALAVAGAFVAPVMAADVTIGGGFEWSYQDTNGATSTKMDNAINFKVAGEASNGISFAGDFNFNSNMNDLNATNHDAKGNSDGSHSLTVAGPFGKVDLGDTNSAIDAINGTTEIAPVLEMGTAGADAAINWTLPTFVDGLTVYVSHSAAKNHDDTPEHDGFAVKYSFGDATIAYGKQDNAAGTTESMINATYEIAGIYVAYEQHTKDDSGVDTDITNIGLSYSVGQFTLGYEDSEKKVGSAAPERDASVLSVAYDLGGGLQVFVASKNDDVGGSTGDITAVGAGLKF